MKKSTEIFSRNLKIKLEEKGRNQNDLARHLQVTPTAVSRWAKGEAMPRANMMDRICLYLGCTAEDLLTDHTKTAVLFPEDIIAEEIHDNPRLFQLFMIALRASDDDLVYCIDYLGKRK